MQVMPAIVGTYNGVKCWLAHSWKPHKLFPALGAIAFFDVTQGNIQASAFFLRNVTDNRITTKPSRISEQSSEYDGFTSRA